MRRLQRQRLHESGTGLALAFELQQQIGPVEPGARVLRRQLDGAIVGGKRGRKLASRAQGRAQIELHADIARQAAGRDRQMLRRLRRRALAQRGHARQLPHRGMLGRHRQKFPAQRHGRRRIARGIGLGGAAEGGFGVLRLHPPSSRPDRVGRSRPPPQSA